MKTVLVVDDEPQIRRALSLNLGARATSVLEAASGSKAVAVVMDEHPDVVLLDLGLPDVDGMIVLAEIRATTDVPVIVLTVRDDECSKVVALAAGADDYITKPFDTTDLVERIVVVLGTEP